MSTRALPAGHHRNVDPVEEGADGCAGQQKVPEPEEEEDLLVEHVDHQHALNCMPMHVAEHLNK